MSVCICSDATEPICEMHGDPVIISQSYLDQLSADLEAAQKERDELKVENARHADNADWAAKRIVALESDLRRSRATEAELQEQNERMRVQLQGWIDGSREGAQAGDEIERLRIKIERRDAVILALRRIDPRLYKGAVLASVADALAALDAAEQPAREDPAQRLEGQLRKLATAFRAYDEALKQVGEEMTGDSCVILGGRPDLDELYAAILAALPSAEAPPAEPPPPWPVAEINRHGLSVQRFARLAEWAARMAGEHGHQLLPMTDEEVEYMTALDGEHGDSRLQTAAENAWVEGKTDASTPA
jgi:hypothetical protein